jgi:hypothetical protein
MGEPPLLDGAVQSTDARASPGVALTALGADGVDAGVTGAVATEATPVPKSFVAVTLKV